MMWSEILTAVALLLVFEGVMPFLTPAGFKRRLLQLLQVPDGQLRLFGLFSMIAGTLILYWIK